MPDDNELGLETLLEAKTEMGVDLDDDLLEACFKIQRSTSSTMTGRCPHRQWTALLRTVSRRPEESNPRTGPDRMKLHSLNSP